MNIVYSTQRGGFLPGVIYRNPRYFQRPMAEGPTRVTVVGDWPAVVAAYEAAGVPVEVVVDPSGAVQAAKKVRQELDDVSAAAERAEKALADTDGDARDALRAEYEALTGEAPDKRWGSRRLQDEIDGARGDA